MVFLEGEHRRWDVYGGMFMAGTLRWATACDFWGGMC
jgi:hypothetical protein